MLSAFVLVCQRPSTKRACHADPVRFPRSMFTVHGRFLPIASTPVLSTDPRLSQTSREHTACRLGGCCVRLPRLRTGSSGQPRRSPPCAGALQCRRTLLPACHNPRLRPADWNASVSVNRGSWRRHDSRRRTAGQAGRGCVTHHSRSNSERVNERSCLDIACSGVQGGSIRIVGLYSVGARDSLAAPPRVTAHFSIASTLSAGSSNSFSYLLEKPWIPHQKLTGDLFQGAPAHAGIPTRESRPSAVKHP